MLSRTRASDTREPRRSQQSGKAAGLPWPETEIIPDVDEFDAFRLARLLTPRLVEVDPESSPTQR